MGGYHRRSFGGALYLDDATEPFASVVPPGTVGIDTTKLEDGRHLVRLLAYDTAGRVGRRLIPFFVQNGPGITVTGLRADERVFGNLSLQVNAFSADEPFDPVRAESSGPIPVWTWVLSAVILGWAVWYGLANLQPPPSYASTPTYAANPIAVAQVRSSEKAPPKYSGTSSAGGFDYSARGAQLYTQNCAACHGADGSGVPGADPPLARDPVVNATNPGPQIAIVVHGLKGQAIQGKSYSGQMPPFAQLSDADVAAVIDHERTSWGNNAPVIAPEQVQRSR
jgi:mono/diheme cytochrome c family protein